MRRTVALVAALALAGTLVFPSVAAPLFSGGDHVSEDVTLAPADGTNGKYARLEDGDLVLDFSRVNPNVTGSGVAADAVTGFDDVFSVRYSGDQYAEVWLTEDSEAVTFYARGHPIGSRGNNVTLAPNESVAVGVRVDTTEAADVRVEDVTVHARVAEPPSSGGQNYELSSRSVTATNDSRRFVVRGVAAGETVTLDAQGLVVDRRGTGAVTLDSVSVTQREAGMLSMEVTRVPRDSAGPLPGGASAESLGAVLVDVGTDEDRISEASMRFSVPRAYLDAVDANASDLALYRHSGGEWSELDVDVAGARDGRVVLSASTSGFSTFVLAAARPDIGVRDAQLASASVSANASVNVTATVANDGAAAGVRDVALTLNGSTVATRSVSLSPGESRQVTFAVSPPPGTYAVRVGGVDAGTLVVRAPADASVDSRGGEQSTTADADSGRAVPEPAGLDLGALLGVVAFAGIAVAAVALARRAPWR